MSPNLILEALSTRRTHKVIGNVESPEKAVMQDHDRISALLRAAGNAPFHVPCDRAHQSGLDSIVPWRTHVFDAKACRSLMNRLIDFGDATKVPAMLAAAEYLIQVTWLPDPVTPGVDDDGMPFEPTIRNMEHIAAASAFVQSLLLAADSAGFRTYWSSGGALRSGDVFGWLSIPASEMHIASVFLFPQTTEHSQCKPGTHANSRGDVTDWSRWQELD